MKHRSGVYFFETTIVSIRIRCTPHYSKLTRAPTVVHPLTRYRASLYEFQCRVDLFSTPRKRLLRFTSRHTSISTVLFEMRLPARASVGALLLLCTLSCAFGRFVHHYPVHLAEIRSEGAAKLFKVPPRRVVRAVDDVGPAVKNATEAALGSAKALLENYANTLRIVTIPGGIIVAFAGYFLLTPVLFVSGLLVGGGTAMVALRALLGDTNSVAVWVSVVIMLAAGVIVGLLAVKMLSVGMFAVGASLGVVLASALKPSVLGHVYPPNADVGFVLGAVVLGLIFGAISLHFQKQMLIFATAYGGAFAFFFGIGYFAGHFPTAEQLARAEKGQFEKWFVVYFLLTVFVGTAGAITQFRLAAKRPLVHSHRRSRSSEHESRWNRQTDSNFEERLHLPKNEDVQDLKNSEGSIGSTDTSKNVFKDETRHSGLEKAHLEGETNKDIESGMTPRYYGKVNVSNALNAKNSTGNNMVI